MNQLDLKRLDTFSLRAKAILALGGAIAAICMAFSLGLPPNAQAGESTFCANQTLPGKEFCSGSRRYLTAEYAWGDQHSVCARIGELTELYSTCSGGPGQGTYNNTMGYGNWTPQIFNQGLTSNVVHGVAINNGPTEEGGGVGGGGGVPPVTYRYMVGPSNGSTFGWNTTNLTSMNQPVAMNVGDVTGDGKEDIIAVEKEASGHYVYTKGISNGSTFAWSGTNLTNMSEVTAMDLGDITGDGKADIVSVEKEVSGRYVYVRGISNGSTFAWAGTGLASMNYPVAMGLGDINGDGKADIVAVEKEASGLYVYCKGISNGAGGFAWSGTNLTGMYQPYAFGLGDINGDGKADIVVAEKEASGLFTYARGISNGTTFAWAGTGLTGMYQPSGGFGLGDVNGDGKADIVAAEKQASNNLYTYVDGISNGAGGFAWSGTNLTNMDKPNPMMTVGDVTGDKKTDIVTVEAN